MSPVPALLACKAFNNPCQGAPSISTHVGTSIQDPQCSGPPRDWITRSTITISGSLQGAQAYEKEYATDSGGTGWTTWVTNTSLTQDLTHGGAGFGADGGGSPVTKYFRARVRVVNGGTACTGWTNSSQISKTENDCAM